LNFETKEPDALLDMMYMWQLVLISLLNLEKQKKKNRA